MPDLSGYMALILQILKVSPADEPMAGRSSAAILAEVSGGMAEGVIKVGISLSKMKKEPEKQVFKKLRSVGILSGKFSIDGRIELKVAVVDGLTGLEKLKTSIAR